jgi:hypothetical protein
MQCTVTNRNFCVSIVRLQKMTKRRKLNTTLLRFQCLFTTARSQIQCANNAFSIEYSMSGYCDPPVPIALNYHYNPVTLYTNTEVCWNGHIKIYEISATCTNKIQLAYIIVLPTRRTFTWTFLIWLYICTSCSEHSDYTWHNISVSDVSNGSAVVSTLLINLVKMFT